MSKIFDVDNKFFSTLSKIWDLMVVDFLFIITLPAFIGPSCTALYYAIVKNIRKSRGYPSKTFFHSFKQNFKQAAIIGIGQLIIGGGLIFSYTFATAMDAKSYIGQVYYWLVLILAILFVMVSIYVYPILSRFTMKTKDILHLSLYMSFRHLPTTMFGLIGIVAIVLIGDYLLLSPFVLLAPAVYVLILSFMMEKVLRAYMPKKEDQDEIEQEAWYYE
ncbi:MAG: DUF624 domain-containing protein [Lachnospiraceae bacterium]|jgi:uncharacterized membrane protein YesL|nr:DUF624 domain-containing protein [Lachnospiraceae bacterium]MCR5465960.1 DUF624 domain-containing protein [Lachnospiraceae bacterium]